MRCFEVYGDCHKSAARIVMLEGARNVLSGRHGELLRDFAFSVGIADRAVQHQSGVSAFCHDYVQLAHCCAARPFLFCLLEGAFEKLDPALRVLPEALDFSPPASSFLDSAGDGHRPSLGLLYAVPAVPIAYWTRWARKSQR
eukprot:s1765_g2.t1